MWLCLTMCALTCTIPAIAGRPMSNDSSVATTAAAAVASTSADVSSAVRVRRACSYRHACDDWRAAPLCRQEDEQALVPSTSATVLYSPWRTAERAGAGDTPPRQLSERVSYRQCGLDVDLIFEQSQQQQPKAISCDF